MQIPTGHKNNPSDLMDVSTGGQPAAGLFSIHDLILNKLLDIRFFGGYQANIQDTVDMRVPDDPATFSLEPTVQDSIRRKTGKHDFRRSGNAFAPWRSLEVRGLYDFQQKDPDWYDGGRGLELQHFKSRHGFTDSDSPCNGTTFHG